MAEDVWACNSLYKTQTDEGGGVLLLPPVSRGPRAVHVAQKLATHFALIGVLRWEFNEAGGRVPVHFCVEVGPLDVYETQLCSLRRRRVPHRPMVPTPRDSHAYDCTEGLQRWGRGKVGSS